MMTEDPQGTWGIDPGGKRFFAAPRSRGARHLLLARRFGASARDEHYEAVNQIPRHVE